MFYAKSNPPETVREHTDRLLENLALLRESYGNRFIHMDDRMWELLKIALEYHDIGKAWSGFQNKIRKQFQLAPLPVRTRHSAPHNYISVGMIPFKEFGLSKEESRLLIHAVGYHHERHELPDKDSLKSILEADILPVVTEVSNHMGLNIAAAPISYRFVDRLKKRYSQHDKEEFYRYVLLKGLVHRIDHASSAGVPIESGTKFYIGPMVTDYMTNRKFDKNPLQQFSEANTEKHVIAIAQTGMGKTESSLLWIDKDKAFFTLPLRVSINAIYDRISKDIGFPAAGLLHSTSIDYLDEHGDENWELLHEQSRHLSSKLLLTTIDQILKFPFGYRGFEKELSAMANAKVVIDEIQAYDPKIAAMLVKALEMIHQVGGKFMVMTATMPTIYLDALRDRKVIDQDQVAYGEFIDDTLLRHRIGLRPESIMVAMDECLEKAKSSQVLIIVNTVRRAVELYEKLLEQNPDARIHLLHSKFTREDRQQLENEIKTFNKTVKEDGTREAGIWITTQLVEASIDIDFDYLYTEISTLDSLFQRLGRCYRKRQYQGEEANIHIFTEDVSGLGYIYDKELVSKGLLLLKEYDGKILLESTKVQMVRSLYSHENLKGTKFLKDFNETLQYFDTLDLYEINAKEAQKKLRDIQSVQVIPYELYEQMVEWFERYGKAKGISERREIRRKIEAKTISIFRFHAEGKISKPVGDLREEIFVLHSPYEFDSETKRGRGILSNEELSPFI
jgi:CRISPR-associated endonuclease/helicase Cas3